jgi:hypothetical protein
MDVTTRNPQMLVMPAYGLRVRGFEEAINLSIRVVEQLHLTDTELVVLFVLGVLRDLGQRFGGQLEVVVKVHESGHSAPLVRVSAQV